MNTQADISRIFSCRAIGDNPVCHIGQLLWIFRKHSALWIPRRTSPATSPVERSLITWCGTLGNLADLRKCMFPFIPQIFVSQMGAISDCVSLKGGQNAMIHLHFTAAHSLWGWSFQGFYKAFDNIVKCAILTRFQWVTKSVKSKFSRKGLWKIYDAWSECHLLQILPRVQPSLADRDTLLVCQFFIYFGSDKSSKSSNIFKFNKTGFHVFDLNDLTLATFSFPFPHLQPALVC